MLMRIIGIGHVVPHRRVSDPPRASPGLSAVLKCESRPPQKKAAGTMEGCKSSLRDHAGGAGEDTMG